VSECVDAYHSYASATPPSACRYSFRPKESWQLLMVSDRREINGVVLILHTHLLAHAHNYFTNGPHRREVVCSTVRTPIHGIHPASIPPKYKCAPSTANAVLVRALLYPF
jgi:hypothetical protein